MQRLRTSVGVVEHELIEPLAVTKGDEPDANAAHRPIIFPCEQRIAVLVVIPTEMVRTELSLCLDASGYDVWAASTGHAAVELAEQMPLDVIVLDLDGMYEVGQEQAMISGFRVLHLLGRLTRERPVAVVVMTSMDFAEVEGPVRASADDFVNKPIEPAQLIRRLRGALDRARTRHQLTASVAW
ncbi:MAG TPA: response regulator [Ktedonobacterales bacterium]